MRKYRPDRYHILNCQKTKLINAVKELSRELNRPVCSQDLKEYFLDHPEQQPRLRQCLGQQLLKTTRKWKTGVPAIHQIGVVGKYAYYASTNDIEWRKKFDNYVLKLSIQNEIKLGIVEKVISLIDSPHEKFACNALAGFAQEWELFLKNESIEEISDLAGVVAEARKYASSKFVRRAPRKLLNRKQAMQFLQKEAARRLGEFRADHINYDRYLSHWNWPQSKLFPANAKLLYIPEQLQLIAQKVWPTCEDDPFQAEALLICSRYGV